MSWMPSYLWRDMAKRLNLNFPKQDNVPRLVSVTGDVLFGEARFGLYQDLHAATGLSGRMKFEDNQLVVNIEEGDIDQLSVPQAQVEFGPLLPAGQARLQLKLNAAGILKQFWTSSPTKVNQLQKLQLDDKVIEGDIEFSFVLAAGIGRKSASKAAT